MALQIALIAVLGWTAGWLINYIADVLPLTRQLNHPVCVLCGQRLSWGEFLLGKPCPTCRNRRPRRFWIVQALSVAGSIWFWLYPSNRLGFWIGWILLVYLAIVAVIDIEHRLILHPVSIVGAGLGLLIGIWLRGWSQTLIGGAAGFGMMLLLYYLGDWFARWLARKRGQDLEEVALGFGDVNLAGVLGLMLGWPGIVAGLLLAILLGGAVSLLIIASQVITRRYTPFTAIPYAPFLILGFIILLYRS